MKKKEILKTVINIKIPKEELVDNNDWRINSIELKKAWEIVRYYLD